MNAVDVRFTLANANGRPPLRAYNSDAGVDLVTSEEMVIPPHKTVNLPTGMAMEMPPGFWALIIGRSSTNMLLGLIVLQGVIDGGYRGELYVRTYNPTERPVTIFKHQRVGQLILFPLIHAKFVQVTELGSGDRGEKGFGSSG